MCLSYINNEEKQKCSSHQSSIHYQPVNDGGIKRKPEAVLRCANIVRRIADAVIPEAKKGETHILQSSATQEELKSSCPRTATTQNREEVISAAASLLVYQLS